MALIGPIVALLFALAAPAAADQIALDSFGYLNNNESAAIIGQEEAQDLLNVDVTPNGKSIKKRSGYGLYKTLASGQAIHGAHHFYDASGNDVQVWGSSTSLWGIVADGTPTQLVSSATLNATWDCADSQGYAYCADSSRNALIRTNGQTITWSTATLGTMVTVTPLRLVIAGVNANVSTLYFSEANNFLNFTTGITAREAQSSVFQRYVQCEREAADLLRPLFDRSSPERIAAQLIHLLPPEDHEAAEIAAQVLKLANQLRGRDHDRWFD